VYGEAPAILLLLLGGCGRPNVTPGIDLQSTCEHGDMFSI
jgi:hypothetical protein